MTKGISFDINDYNVKPVKSAKEKVIYVFSYHDSGQKVRQKTTGEGTKWLGYEIKQVLQRTIANCT